MSESSGGRCGRVREPGLKRARCVEYSIGHFANGNEAKD